MDWAALVNMATGRGALRRGTGPGCRHAAQAYRPAPQGLFLLAGLSPCPSGRRLLRHGTAGERHGEATAEIDVADVQRTIVVGRLAKKDAAFLGRTGPRPDLNDQLGGAGGEPTAVHPNAVKNVAQFRVELRGGGFLLSWRKANVPAGKGLASLEPSGRDTTGDLVQVGDRLR